MGSAFSAVDNAIVHTARQLEYAFFAGFVFQPCLVFLYVCSLCHNECFFDCKGIHNNNHIGIKIGEVKKVNYGKKFNEIYFTSNYDLSKKSSIKLFDGIKEVSTISLFDLKQIDTNLYMTTSTQKAYIGNYVNIISADITT